MIEAKLKLLAERYSSQCPRYTSYPTAIEMKAGQVDIVAIPQNVSLYIHLPFCKQTCLFCACNRFASSNPKEDKSNYIKLLDKELSLYQNLGALNLDSIHLGGGTPSFFDAQELKALNDVIEKYAVLPSNAEKSIEIDPRFFCDEQARCLQELGYKRASLGVQDFNPEVEKAIGRVQSFQETADCLKSLRKHGFQGVNFDLVYGLPMQTTDSFKKTLKQVLELEPDRVALYGFAYVPWKAKQQAAIPAESLPNAKQRLELFFIAKELFIAAGYNYIGLDHFAKKGDQLSKAYKEKKLKRNFMGYTTTAKNGVLGVGVSAISDINGLLIQNYYNLTDYAEALNKGSLPQAKYLKRSDEDIIRGKIIEEIMCYGEIDYQEIVKLFNLNKPLSHYICNQSALEAFTNDGIVKVNEEKIKVIEPLFLRQVASIFDSYLLNHQNKQRFSQGT